MRRQLILCFLLIIIFFKLSAQDFSLSYSFSQDQFVRFNLTKINKKQKAISLSSPLNLFVFLSPECPLCKNYSVSLNRIQKQYEDDLNIIGIVPGKAYSTKEVKQYISDYKINFSVYIDSQKELTSYVKGTVTPEVILINSQGNLIYRGAIDDWVQELGKKKLKPQELYLETAISQYLKGESITQRSTIPKGCLINEF